MDNNRSFSVRSSSARSFSFLARFFSFSARAVSFFARSFATATSRSNDGIVDGVGDMHVVDMLLR